MDDTEIWAPVPTFTRYEVSNLGNVRNAFTGQILHPFKGYGKDGCHYLKVHLYRNGVRFCVFVHRIVVFAFYEVDHKNRDKGCNALSNLEPVLPSINRERWRKLEEVPF